MSHAITGKGDELFSSRYFSGRSLYGDDFSQGEIEAWYKDEEYAYFDLQMNEYRVLERYGYVWHYLNYYHGFRFLAGRHFPCCAVLGVARGDEVVPLAPQVDRFIAIEPAEKWWKSEIGGKPATFLKPAITGEMPLASGSIDLMICLNVLHHIPNVSFVLSEISRVLRPKGTFILHEPIFSMGDWRKPRSGLTPRERGLPLKWLDDSLAARGFRIGHRRFAEFPVVPRVAAKFGIVCFNNSTMTILDSLISRVTACNLHYHRDRLWKKLAPGTVFFVLEKQ